MTMAPYSGTIKQSIKWMENDAPRIQSLVGQKSDWYDTFHAQFWDDWEKNVFNLKTVNPFGIRVWCEILGVPSSLFGLYLGDETSWAYGASRQNFVYSGSTPDPDSNLIGGNFYGGGGTTIVSLKEARLALMLRYAALVSNGRISFVNKMLAWIFNDGPWAQSQFQNKEYFYLMDSTGIPQYISAQIFRNDWQGNQLLYATPRTNLLTFPRNYERNIYAKSGMAVYEESILAPDNKSYAAKLVEFNASSVEHLVQQSFSVAAGTQVTYSAFVKAAERTFVLVGFSGGGVGDVFVGVNLTNGTVVSTLGSPEAYTVTNAGNGWYRVSCTKTIATTASVGIRIWLSTNGSTIFYSGNGTSGVYAWHSQLESGATVTSAIPDETLFVSRASPKHAFDASGVLQLIPINVAAIDYDPVTHIKLGTSLEMASLNVLSYPRNLDNSVWSKQSTYVVPGAAPAPDGTRSADKLVEQAVTGVHYMYRARTGTNETLTFSAVVSAAERFWVRLELSNFVNASVGAQFNISTGTITGVDSPNADYTNVSARIDPLGNGNYLIALTATKGSVNSNSYANIILLNNAGANSYTGDGLSGLYIWHAQLESAAKRSSIIPDNTAFVSRASVKNEFNPAGVLAQYANDVEVTAYDPATLVSRGVSLEAAATNSIRNNTMVGFGVGAPGVLPTNWVRGSNNGLASEVVASGTLNGISYIDIRVYGSATSIGFYSIGVEAANWIAAVTGQTWTFSAFVRMSAGSMTSLSTVNLCIDENTAGSFVAGGSAVLNLVGTTLPTSRQSYTRTLNGGVTVATVYPHIKVFNNAIGPVDITLRIGLPQIEQGFTPSSIMKTSGSAFVRAADISSSSGATRATDVANSPQVTTTDYVLTDLTGEITFDIAPEFGAVLTWSGIWGESAQPTPIQFGTGDGSLTDFQLPPPYGNLNPVANDMVIEYRVGANLNLSEQFFNIMNSPEYGIMPTCAGVSYSVVKES